jgi:hypothetical protein
VWSSAIDAALRAARRLHGLGYFGPLGIDAMRYRAADGSIRLRSLQDINARWTMGRLSLGWQRCLQPGDTGCWRHGPTESGDGITGRRTVRTSPEVVGGSAVDHQSWVVVD